MSNLLVQNIKHTNNTTAIVVNSSGHVATDTINGNSTAGSISVVGEGGSTTTNLQQGLAKCWIHFNGSSTPSAGDSFNHSSITDEGTGSYIIGITNDHASVSYSCPGGHSTMTNGHSFNCIHSFNTGSVAILVSADTSGANCDSGDITLQTIGDLA